MGMDGQSCGMLHFLRILASDRKESCERESKCELLVRKLVVRVAGFWVLAEHGLWRNAVAPERGSGTVCAVK